MMDHEIDLMYKYNYDNPFENDKMNTLKRQLQATILKNKHNFVSGIDVLEDSRYLILCAGGNPFVLFNNKYSGKYDYKLPPMLKSSLQKFFMTISGLPTELQQWAGSYKEAEVEYEEVDNTPAAPFIAPTNPYTNTIEDHDEDEYAEYGNDIVPNEPFKFICNNMSLTSYDATTDRCITYEDLRKIVINLARSKISNEIVKNENVIRMEEEKRKVLINDINGYRAINEIGIINDSDLTKMDIPQLETTLIEVKRLYEHRKTIEVFKKGTGLCSTAYDMIFPNGIPISKTKSVNFNGVGDELLKVLFDERTAPGKACSEILKKKNVHVSDEMMLLVAFTSAVLGKVTITDRVIEGDKDDVDVNLAVKQQKALTNGVKTDMAENDVDEEEDEYDEYEEEDDDE